MVKGDGSGLPIMFGPCSNVEYDPVPLSPLVLETVRRARKACEPISLEIPSGLQTYGPGTSAERDAFVTAHHGVP